LTEINSAASVNVLFGALRLALETLGVPSFAVYTIDGPAATLAFSCGDRSSFDAQDVARLELAEHAFVGELLPATLPFLVLDETELGEVIHSWGPSAVLLRLGSFEPAIGFVALLGFDPAAFFPLLHDFTQLAAAFATSFQRLREHDVAHRAWRRAQSKLEELQDGLEILLSPDQAQMLHAILDRVLPVLSSSAGAIWLRQEQNEWEQALAIGEQAAVSPSLLARCLERRQPVMVGSLSDEEVWELDVDSLHMAQVVVLPLATRAAALGCVVAFDATVSRDLLDMLSGTALIATTAIQSWHSQQRMLEQQRVHEQIAVAARVQQRLLPGAKPQIRGLDVAYFSRYCDETGGDYVDYIRSADGRHWSFLVGDVAGHGLGAAMLMVDTRARLRTHLEADGATAPAEVLGRVSARLFDESEPHEFVTLALLSVDSVTGQLSYVGAGHEPPLVYRARSGTWEELASTGLPLGMVENESYRVERTRLETGDILVMATDGVTEAEDAQGRPFDTDSIKEVIVQCHSNNADAIAESLADRLLTHRGKPAFMDDVSYLVVKVGDLNLRWEASRPQVPGKRVYHHRFSSTPSEKERCLNTLFGLLGERYPNHDLNEVFMATEEALSNAVRHGNQEDPQKQVEIELWLDERTISLVIADQGAGFDLVRSLPDYRDEQAVTLESGRGLMIMVALMNEVTFWNHGTSVCLVRRLE
jgi:serine phosphatase RsbU (regulator of sigma subunit)/anti-sigma regulatory factor (Ser/Thr protein kinase)